MKLSEIIALVVTIAIATVFVLLVQPWLFDYPVIPLTMANKQIQDWSSAILWPISWSLYGLGLLLTFIWIVKASTSRFTRAEEVLSTKWQWWLMTFFFIVLGIFIFMGLSFFNGWFDGKRSLEPVFWFPLFIFIDWIFLFWLPTALATPKSMRYVPPLSMTLRNLYRG